MYVSFTVWDKIFCSIYLGIEQQLTVKFVTMHYQFVLLLITASIIQLTDLVGANRKKIDNALGIIPI